jgi:hypothetical protein
VRSPNFTGITAALLFLCHGLNAFTMACKETRGLQIKRIQRRNVKVNGVSIFGLQVKKAAHLVTAILIQQE